MARGGGVNWRLLHRFRSGAGSTQPARGREWTGLGGFWQAAWSPAVLAASTGACSVPAAYRQERAAR